MRGLFEAGDIWTIPVTEAERQLSGIAVSNRRCQYMPFLNDHGMELPSYYLGWRVDILEEKQDCKAREAVSASNERSIAYNVADARTCFIARKLIILEESWFEIRIFC